MQRHCLHWIFRTQRAEGLSIRTKFRFWNDIPKIILNSEFYLLNSVFLKILPWHIKKLKYNKQMQKGILNGFTADYFTTRSSYYQSQKIKKKTCISSENVRKKYMNLFKKIVALGFFALLFSSVQAQSLSSEEKDILQLQDQRSLGGGRLAGYLSSTDENLRYRALIALPISRKTLLPVSLFRCSPIECLVCAPLRRWHWDISAIRLRRKNY